MRKRDKAYSRVVNLLKVVLPLLALALLSTVFLIARTLDPEDALPWATVNIEELLADPRLTAPEFAGMTDAGDELLFVASKAWPGNGTGAHAAEPVLRLISPEGEESRIEAQRARIDPTARELVLEGEVRLRSEADYALMTERLLTHLDRTRLSAPGPVELVAPGLQLQAGAMELTRQAGARDEVVVFNGGVRLLYQPQPRPPLQPE